MKYGIELGQVYEPSDGSLGKLVVIECEEYQNEEEVLVWDTLRVESRYIDAFKLAKVRYSLVNKKETS